MGDRRCPIARWNRPPPRRRNLDLRITTERGWWGVPWKLPSAAISSSRCRTPPGWRAVVVGIRREQVWKLDPCAAGTQVPSKSWFVDRQRSRGVSGCPGPSCERPGAREQIWVMRS